MQRLDIGEGNSTLLSIRVSQKTTENLAALIANLPPHPVAGRLPRPTVLRAVIDAGIEAVANRDGVKLGTTPKPVARKARKKKPTLVDV